MLLANCPHWQLGNTKPSRLPVIIDDTENPITFKEIEADQRWEDTISYPDFLGAQGHYCTQQNVSEA